MDPQGTSSSMYNLSEIWPGFAANATSSFGLDLDPMVMDQRSINHNSTKKRLNQHNHNDDFSKNGTCYNNGNANHNNFDTLVKSVQNEGDSKRRKAASNEKSENKVEGVGNSDKVAEQSAKPAEPTKQDYIHVRARRGQATDNHSLAERARREKISERMKTLQDIVPGCNKVIGKALVLDEIINYIQSLQRQVEFLSLKLEAVNARGIDDGYPSKDFAQQTFDASGMPFGSQSSREYGRGLSPEWLHMQLGGGGFERS